MWRISIKSAGFQNISVQKAAISELLREGLVGRPVQVFARYNATYHKKDITHIRFYVYWERSQLAKNVIGCNANSLCIYRLGDVISCTKDTLVVNEKPFEQSDLQNFQRTFYIGQFSDLRMLILRYPTSFMASLVK